MSTSAGLGLVERLAQVVMEPRGWILIGSFTFVVLSEIYPKKFGLLLILIT